MSTSGFRGLGFRGAARKHEMQSTAIAALAIYPFCRDSGYMQTDLLWSILNKATLTNSKTYGCWKVPSADGKSTKWLVPLKAPLCSFSGLL